VCVCVCACVRVHQHAGLLDLFYRQKKKVVLKVKNEYDLLLCILVKISEVDVHNVSV